jgi:hypothetical protein
MCKSCIHHKEPIVEPTDERHFNYNYLALSLCDGKNKGVLDVCSAIKL